MTLMLKIFILVHGFRRMSMRKFIPPGRPTVGEVNLGAGMELRKAGVKAPILVLGGIY